MASKLRNIKKTFYEYYWLRPENALWRFRDFQMMKDIEIASPSLDFGGGDGAISFLNAEGVLTKNYDAFSEVKTTKNFFLGSDVYDQSSNNHYRVISKKPKYQFDIGFDVKENLLNKAKKLNIYKKIVLGDGNQKLPFENNEFKTIFSNILYWLENPKRVLVELHRILEKKGKLILFVPNKNILKYSFFQKYYFNQKNKKFSFLKKLDLGRFSNNIKSFKGYNEWKDLFFDSQFRIEHSKEYLSGTMVRLWDVGLRPFSPFTIEMANSLNLIKRKYIKMRWVNETFELFDGFSDIQEDLEKKEPTAFIFFVLRKM